MLYIFEGKELDKLSLELASLRRDIPKNKAKDDFTDAFRYAVTRIPWDWSAITGEVLDIAPDAAKTPMELEIEERRKQFDTGEESDSITQAISEEFEEINGLLDGF